MFMFRVCPTSFEEPLLSSQPSTLFLFIHAQILTFQATTSFAADLAPCFTLFNLASLKIYGRVIPPFYSFLQGNAMPI